MTKTGLLVIDMQVGLFADGLRVDAEGVVSRINALARAVRAGGGHVVFVQHEDEGSFVRGEPAWELLPTLDCQAGDATVSKTACDSFYRSDLDRVLRERGIRRLLVTGCATDFCVDTTIRSAASKDYDVIVVADGHTTKDRPHLDARTIITHHNSMWSNLILPEHPVRVVPARDLLADL
jgi:nicotinamidase-related amidase